MTFATFVPAIALLLLIPCVLVSQQVGTAFRTLYLVCATRTLSQAGFPNYQIWQKSDTGNYLSTSTWFVGVTAWLGSLWIMVMLAGLLIRTDVMQVLAETFSYGSADGSVAWQVMTFIVLATSLVTHDHELGPVRGQALARDIKPDAQTS